MRFPSLIAAFSALCAILFTGAFGGEAAGLGSGASAAYGSSSTSGISAVQQGGLGGTPGLVRAIFSLGDSYAVLTGSTFGTTLAQRLDGRFAIYAKSGEGYPGQGTSTILSHLRSTSLSNRLSVVILEGGRNTVTTDLAGAKTDTQSMVTYLAGLGNVRYILCEVPLKPSEVTAGAGTAGYDAVVAFNVWLTATFGAGHVCAAQDLANTYPSGDDTHMSNTGYDVWCTRLSDAIAALGYLTTSLPTSRAAHSFTVATGKYLRAQPPITALDRMPSAPSTTESTWAVWAKATSGASAGYIIGRNDGTTSTARMGMRYFSGQLQAYLGNAITIASTTAVPVDTSWHLVSVTFRNITGTYKGSLYLDGAQLGVATTAGAMSATPEVRCGESSSGTSFLFAGLMYQPLVWSVGLTSAEETTLYNAGVPLAPSASPQSASIAACPDADNATQTNVIRCIPDRSGKLDWQTVGYTGVEIVTTIP